MSLDLTDTLILLAAGLLVIGVSAWQVRRPYEPGRLPWVPWTAILFLGLLVSIVMAAHLITLVTGEPFRGRRGF